MLNVRRNICSAHMTGGTDGAFDPTIYPLVGAWGFLTEAPHVPDSAEIADALARVDYRRLVLSGRSVRVGPDMGVDFGGVAKGYASDRLIRIFRARGVKSAIVSLGGTAHPDQDGTEPWFAAELDLLEESRRLPYCYLITSSHGIATRKAGEEKSLEALVREADHAMYLCKQQFKKEMHDVR